jgi:hypothetical protein
LWVETSGVAQRSHVSGVARCTLEILIVLIYDAPSELVNRCHSIPGKIFNFVPGNDARNVSVITSTSMEDLPEEVQELLDNFVDIVVDDKN